MKYSILSLALLMSTASQADIMSDMFEDIQKMEARMEAHIKEVQQQMSSLTEQQSKTSSAKLSWSLEDTNEALIVHLALPAELGSKGISVEAKGNNLDGQATLIDSGVLKFAVTNGRLLSMSYQLTSESEKGDDKKNKQAMRILAEQQRTLPITVANLEQATVEVVKKEIVLSLPKATTKNGWKKLAIKQE